MKDLFMLFFLPEKTKKIQDYIHYTLLFLSHACFYSYHDAIYIVY